MMMLFYNKLYVEGIFMYRQNERRSLVDSFMVKDVSFKIV